MFKPAVTGLDEGGEPDHELLRSGRRLEAERRGDRPLPLRPGRLAASRRRARRRGRSIRRCSRPRGRPATAPNPRLRGRRRLPGPAHPRLPGPRPRDRARPSGRDRRRSRARHDQPHSAHHRSGAGGRPGLAAVVLTPWPGEPDEIERSNRETIEGLGKVRVEALPEIDLAGPASWPALDLLA